MTERSGRLGVGIIGAGRVGPVLGAALSAAGHTVVGITAVSQGSRDRAEAMLPGVPILEIPELIERAELVILAVPSDRLAELVGGLAAAGVWQAGQLVLHTAPEFGWSVLQPALAAGAIPLAVHPALAFTGTSVDLVRLRDSYAAVSAPTPVLPIAQAVVVELGAEPIVIDEVDRPAYAEAVATATAFSSEIVRQAVGILAAAGVESPARLLGPLVRSSVETALAASAEFPAR